MQEISDIIIIGGGIIGLTSAWMLRKQGKSVTVIDQKAMGLEASWAAGGILSSLQPWAEPEPIACLASYSQEHYASFCYELMEKSGVDAEWQQSGMFVTKETIPVSANDWLERQALNEEQTANVDLGVSSISKHKQKTGYLLADVAQLKPPALLLSLKTALAMTQVKLVENTKVDSILHNQFKATGVKAGDKTYIADKVLVCSGAWSKSLSSELDIIPMKGEMLSIRANENWQLKQILLDQGKYCIPRLDGSLVIGSTLQDSGFDQTVTEDAKNLLLEWAQKFIPDITDSHIQQHWSGLRPQPHNRKLPIIAESSNLKGLYYSTGHFRNGILLALGSARLITDLICEKETFIKVDSFGL